jgi:uncharacterized protein YkwD
MPRHLPPFRCARGTLATILALVVALGAAATHPPPAAAATPTRKSAEASLLAWTNRDRAAIGLRPLRSDPRLVAIAETRAENLAGVSTFSHAAAGGDLAPAFARAGVQWYAWGENIARQPGRLTSATVVRIYEAWRGSRAHWALLMSPTMNYVGFGVAARASDGQVFGGGVFTESRDHTAPGAKIDGVTRSGTTVTFAWHGYDPLLQSHWSGLRDYDAWYRIDGGAWRLVRDNTTATSLRLASRPNGHRYWLMVRARDRAGNIGRASAPVSVWVP